jgi:hypothetical protein
VRGEGDEIWAEITLILFFDLKESQGESKCALGVILTYFYLLFSTKYSYFTALSHFDNALTYFVIKNRRQSNDFERREMNEIEIDLN